MPTQLELLPDRQDLIDRLLERSRLYRTGPDFLNLLRFVGKMRHMAPFNAMLVQMQKPGIQFAATQADWYKRFNRVVVEGARPLIIMWPHGPVGFVYDVLDTDGPALPVDIAAPFRATGDITSDRMQRFIRASRRKRIFVEIIEYGEAHAGKIVAVRRGRRADESGSFADYEVRLNERHDPNVQFATLAHELGHLFLGHLGGDTKLKVSSRLGLEHAQQELEAEAVSYLVCDRQGVNNVSEAYLSSFLGEKGEVPYVDVHAIMKAVNRVESMLGLSVKMDMEGAGEPIPMKARDRGPEMSLTEVYANVLCQLSLVQQRLIEGSTQEAILEFTRLAIRLKLSPNYAITGHADVAVFVGRLLSKYRNDPESVHQGVDHLRRHLWARFRAAQKESE